MSCGGAAPRNNFDILAQPELLAHAGELRAADNRRDLLDLARKTYSHADNYCWGSDKLPVQAPSAKMSSGALYDNIVNVCQQTLGRRGSKSSSSSAKAPYCGACAGRPAPYNATNGSGGRRLSAGKRGASGGVSRYNNESAANLDNNDDLVAEYREQLRSLFGDDGDAETVVQDDDGVAIFDKDGIDEDGYLEDPVVDRGRGEFDERLDACWVPAPEISVAEFMRSDARERFGDAYRNYRYNDIEGRIDRYVCGQNKSDDDVQSLEAFLEQQQQQQQQRQNGGGDNSRQRTVVIPRSQRDVMASKIINAVKYDSMPYSSEVRRAKAKQIEWDYNLERPYVSVVRRNNARFDKYGKQRAPTETRYIYHTPERDDFRELVGAVINERDRLVQQARYRNYNASVNGGAGVGDVVAGGGVPGGSAAGETSAIEVARQRVDMAQVPSFWLATLMPRLGFVKESQSPSGQVTFRRGQMTIVTEPCPGSNGGSVCNATINGIDAKKLATQILGMIEKAGGLRGILSKLPIGALAQNAGALGSLGQLGQLGRLLA